MHREALELGCEYQQLRRHREEVELADNQQQYLRMHRQAVELRCE
jgi:hypothetical protein